MLLDKLLKAARPEASDCEDLKVFCNYWEWRNQIFHRLLRLRKEDLFEAWDTTNQQHWKLTVSILSDYKSSSLKDASLMPLVHEELKEAITSYHP